MADKIMFNPIYVLIICESLTHPHHQCRDAMHQARRQCCNLLRNETIALQLTPVSESVIWEKNVVKWLLLEKMGVMNVAI